MVTADTGLAQHLAQRAEHKHRQDAGFQQAVQREEIQFAARHSMRDRSDWA